VDDGQSGTGSADAVRKFWEDAWTEGRVDVLDDILHAGFRENGEPVDVAEFQRGLASWREIFPDFSVTIDELLTVAPDRVVTRVTYRGTHRGTLWGLQATDRPTEAIGIDLFRVEDGRIIELWHAVDHLQLVLQIGGTVAPRSSV
jgi:predicted ester cyclase